ncbi:MAG: 1,4-alpha-glucan branching protein GlgB [Clostridia bacterium]|nr:1,4-alpha-glucan branching protein GlgB [Clostridia bacterium]
MKKEDRFFGELDTYLFHHGTHYQLYEKMGAHIREINGVRGVHFVVWAPNARAICVVSDGNGWTPWRDVMEKVDDCIWELFVPGMCEGVKYKYHIVRADGRHVLESDPYGNAFELRPGNANIVMNLDNYQWHDDAWRQSKKNENFLEKPMAVYEVHPGSWKKDWNKWDEDKFYDYRRLAHELAEYVEYMGYTHVELMGISEYPFDGSWGYQVTGYFAPTSRYGSPEDFMYFVDYMHQHNIGVILDWVPAHFPKDEWGLAEFDGTPLYEYTDPLRAEYPQWGTKAFDLGRPEVSNFLIASAFFWVNKYHVDALRADAVAAMLYNSFGRDEWRPNKYGNDFNLESFEFFRHLNTVLRQRTDAFIIAEDSSIVSGVTAPAKDDGLGFGLKWDMGWMNDTIRYYNEPSIYRRYIHHLMTGTFDYVFLENYILVLSHDEVVHGKGSMFNKMSGSHQDKIGSLKTCYTMMMGHPGKKLLFMGQDFGQEAEWDYKGELQWHLCDDPGHREIMDCYRSLLHIYTKYPVLYNDAGKQNVFEWINNGDYMRNIFSFIRRNPWNYNDGLVFVCNFAPVNRDPIEIGVPVSGTYRRIFTTYGDPEPMNLQAYNDECDGRPYRIVFTLRPFESVIFEIPFHESTEEELAEEKKIRDKVKEEHESIKTSTSHVPQRDEELLRTSAEKDGIDLAALSQTAPVQESEEDEGDETAQSTQHALPPEDTQAEADAQYTESAEGKDKIVVKRTIKVVTKPKED